MKLLAEYVEHARHFDELARGEKNSQLKAQLQAQANAYRKLAIERAKRLGMHGPPEPKDSG